MPGWDLILPGRRWIYEPQVEVLVAMNQVELGFLHRFYIVRGCVDPGDRRFRPRYVRAAHTGR